MRLIGRSVRVGGRCMGRRQTEEKEENEAWSSEGEEGGGSDRLADRMENREGDGIPRSVKSP